MAETEGATRPEYSHLLRVRTTDADLCRQSVEPKFSGLFTRWKYMGKTKEDEGIKVLEYGVVPIDTVTIGVVSDALRSVAAANVRGVELRT